MVSVDGEYVVISCHVLQLVSLLDSAQSLALLAPGFIALLCYSGLSQACSCCQLIKDTFVFTDVDKDFWGKMGRNRVGWAGLGWAGTEYDGVAWGSTK